MGPNKRKRPVVKTGRSVWVAEGDSLSRSSGHAQDGLGPKDVAVVRMVVKAGESHGAERNGATKVPSMRGRYERCAALWRRFPRPGPHLRSQGFVNKFTML